ncbi:hypothetical protein BH23ACT3_BH23ACT3_03130 [soil metagenome]
MAASVSSEHHTHLARLATLAAERRVTPSIDSCYPLDRAADAMRRLDAGLARGKLVVIPTTDTTDPEVAS